MDNKLALGTVQFGLNYGINNVTGQVPVQEIKNILRKAKNEHVSILDTAQSYGNCEEIMGKLGISDFAVVTKFSALKHGEKLSDVVSLSLNALQIKSLYGFLFHDFNYWLSEPQSWFDLQSLKNLGIINKIGFSLYHPRQWDILKGNGIIPDLLQVPMNLLNQNFLDYLPEIKRLGIEVHIRSAFSQGLLLMNPEDLHEQFLEVRPQINLLNKLAEKSGVSRMHICMLWLWQNRDVDHIVVGVDSLSQWEENILAAEWCQQNVANIQIDASSFICRNEYITNPSKWNKK